MAFVHWYALTKWFVLKVCWKNNIPSSKGWLHKPTSFSFFFVLEGNFLMNKAFFPSTVPHDQWKKGLRASQSQRSHIICTWYMSTPIYNIIHGAWFISDFTWYCSYQTTLNLHSKFITETKELFLAKFLSWLQLSHRNTQSCWLLSTSYSQSLVWKSCWFHGYQSCMLKGLLYCRLSFAMPHTHTHTHTPWRWQETHDHVVIAQQKKKCE